MNKKQRNRKTVQQNNRNRIINKRYSSTSKGLAKLFLNKVKFLKNPENIISDEDVKLQVKNILNKLFSIIDKAVKKGILHKNTAARKKSKFSKLYSNL